MLPAEADRPLVLISPVRDEAAGLPCTAASVLAQRVGPAAWVVVDDGSTDGTWELLGELARRVPCLRPVRLARRGPRQPGPAVVRAFQAGLAAVEDLGWGFVGKLDGDVLLPGDYYARLLEAFGREPRLGIAGGACLAPRSPRAGRFRLEPSAPEHTRGPCKVWRRECLEDIGGLRPVLGWDGLDGAEARRRGWRTRTLPGLFALHLRPTHSGDGPFRGARRAGRGAWQLHHAPAYLAARALAALLRPPWALGALGLLVGYLEAAWRGERAELPAELVQFLRTEQRARLLGVLGRLPGGGGAR